MSTRKITPTLSLNNTGFDCVSRAWRAHEKELRAFLIHRADDRDMAEDLLQEVFLKSMRQGLRFCELTNPRAWLFEVARNALIDSVSLNKPFEELPEHLEAELGSERAPIDELDICIERILSELAAEDRSIIQSCDLQGKTVRSYAQDYRLTLAAAKSRILRARKRLRDSLVERCQVGFDETGRVCCHVPRTLS
ncbi:sigma-70 family RNA polymerase sigma factor [Pseudomonas aeruginosa]|uniref:RNA polymerase sigma factor n=3 Tax=Pseudomonadota TaxID=1224 RepID=A0A844NFW1_PSEAI|nr:MULTISPECIES: sigma-70 family RNA polymerase sigma factor [Pseudomonadota]EKW7746844.1 sigma-70 family RNA polymerase sigma factor [Morganella morganii]HAH4225986.1 RNA polymerase subunit sigma-70 [Escherichia coli]AWS89931.1 RNA polymerase subunit sigma-70 [Pseudomonas aeruginosa]AWT28711.1 RNA polymerase subunit sigma-70 [Pseudomonas aeruginosa]AXZ94828.1 sigma-70 family RNA polymerase sigma factor [Pseudomonas aeruginosa]